MCVGPSQQAGNTYSGNWTSIKFLGTYPSWLPSSALNHSSWLLKICTEENEGQGHCREVTKKQKKRGYRMQNALLDLEANKPEKPHHWSSGGTGGLSLEFSFSWPYAISVHETHGVASQTQHSGAPRILFSFWFGNSRVPGLSTLGSTPGPMVGRQGWLPYSFSSLPGNKEHFSNLVCSFFFFFLLK